MKRAGEAVRDVFPFALVQGTLKRRPDPRRRREAPGEKGSAIMVQTFITRIACHGRRALVAAGVLAIVAGCASPPGDFPYYRVIDGAGGRASSIDRYDNCFFGGPYDMVEAQLGPDLRYHAYVWGAPLREPPVLHLRLFGDEGFTIPAPTIRVDTEFGERVLAPEGAVSVPVRPSYIERQRFQPDLFAEEPYQVTLLYRMPPSRTYYIELPSIEMAGQRVRVGPLGFEQTFGAVAGGC